MDYPEKFIRNRDEGIMFNPSIWDSSNEITLKLPFRTE